MKNKSFRIKVHEQKGSLWSLRLRRVTIVNLLTCIFILFNLFALVLQMKRAGLEERAQTIAYTGRSSPVTSANLPGRMSKTMPLPQVSLRKVTDISFNEPSTVRRSGRR